MQARPDRTAAEHDRALVAGDPALGDGVDADRERFGHRGDVGAKTVGDLDADHLVEHHQLGVAAVVDVGESDGVQARQHRTRRAG